MNDTLSKILSITREELNAIDFGFYAEMADEIRIPQHWFFLEAGVEHYRLLAFISSVYDNQFLLDIGSYQGDSAIALSHNKKNRVLSYDVVQQPEIRRIHTQGIEFRVGDILEFPEVILSAPFIMLDTYHEGEYEDKFIKLLNEINYQGLVLFDDIYLNDAMRKMWADLPNEKYDLSHIGHHSGTGLAVWK